MNYNIQILSIEQDPYTVSIYDNKGEPKHILKFSAFHIYVSKSLNWFQKWMWKVCFGVEIETVDENDRVEKPVDDIGKNETNLEERREMDKSDKWE